MTQLVTDLNILTTPKADFTVTDTTALANSTVDVLYKMNSSGWDKLHELFPDLGSVIDSTSQAVNHVNTFIVYNISDSPWQLITSNFQPTII